MNEINPQEQPNKLELEQRYGFIAPTGSFPVDVKTGNIWNEIDAWLYRNSFAKQVENYFDLDKKYIW